MKKKSILLIILCALILSSLIFAIGEDKDCSGALSKRECLSAQQVVQDFLDKLSKWKITKIEVYYVHWSTVTSIAVSEHALLNNHCDYKVRVRDCPPPRLSNRSSKIDKALREFRFERAEAKYLDYRIGFLFYAGDEEVMRLFFAKNVPAVKINGEQFSTSVQLMESLTPLLPHDAYQGMRWGMVESWQFAHTQMERASGVKKENPLLLQKKK